MNWEFIVLGAALWYAVHLIDKNAKRERERVDSIIDRLHKRIRHLEGWRDEGVD